MWIWMSMMVESCGFQLFLWRAIRIRLYIQSILIYKDFMKGLSHVVSSSIMPYQNAKILLASIKQQIQASKNPYPIECTSISIDANARDKEINQIFSLYNSITSQIKSLKPHTSSKPEEKSIIPILTPQSIAKMPETNLKDLGETFEIIKKALNSSQDKDVLERVSASCLSPSDKKELQLIVKTIKEKLHPADIYKKVLSNLHQPSLKIAKLDVNVDEETLRMFNSFVQMKKSVEQSIQEMRSAKILSGNPKENAPSFWSDQLLTPIKGLLQKKPAESKEILSLKKADSVKVQKLAEVQSKEKVQAQLDALNSKSQDLYRTCLDELFRCNGQKRQEMVIASSEKSNLEMIEQLITKDFRELFDFFVAVYEERCGKQNMLREMKGFKVSRKLETVKNTQHEEFASKQKKLQAENQGLFRQLHEVRRRLEESQQAQLSNKAQIDRITNEKSDEISKLSQQIHQLKDQLKSQEQNIRSQNDKNVDCINTQSAQMNKLKIQNESFKTDLFELRREKQQHSSEMQKKTTSHQSIYTEKEDRIKQIERQFKKLETTSKTFAQERDQIRQELQKAQKSLKQKQDTIEQINIQKNSIAQAQNKINVMAEQNTNQKLLIEELKKENNNLKSVIQQKTAEESNVLTAKILYLNKQVESCNSLCDKQKEEKEKAIKQLQAKSKQLASSQETARRLQEEKQSLRGEVNHLKTDRTALQRSQTEKLDNLSRNIAELKGQREKDKKQLQDYIAELNKTKQLLRNKQQEEKRRQNQAEVRQEAQKNQQIALRNNIRQRQQHIQAMNQRLASILNDNQTLKANLSESNSNYAKLTQMYNQAVQKRDRTLADHQTVLKRSSQENQQYKTALHASKQIEEQLMTENNSLKSLIERLQQTKNVLTLQLKECNTKLEELLVENHQLSMKKSSISKIGARYLSLSKLHGIDIEEVAHVDKNFDFDILTDHFEHKINLIRHIEDLKKEQLVKSKLLFRYDQLNPTNFHKYIDNRSNLLCLVKTAKGALIASFYSGEYLRGEPMVKPALLISLNNNLAFELYSILTNQSGRQFRGMTYDDFFLIFGNAELRIRANERTIFSNFGIGNSYFNNRSHRVNDILMEGDKREVDLQSYEIYELTFSNEAEKVEE